MKTKLFDKKLLQQFNGIFSVIVGITTLLFIFIDIPKSSKTWIGLTTLLLLIICYIIMWYKSNNIKSIILNIDSSPVEIKFGNLFKEKGLKVIAFNEFFDTKVDNKVIAESSLNGFFINNYVKDIIKFNNEISKDNRLQEKILEVNYPRTNGKTTKYKLGSIFVYEEYLLTAFSHFDKDNRAYLSMQDYLGFLVEFWNEIDIIYAGRTIILPLLGAGLTRFRGYEGVSEQELLEIIIWSFKLSRIRFKHPSKVQIVVDYDKKDKISLFKLSKFN